MEQEIKAKKCVCGKYHCPECYNQMYDYLPCYCPVCSQYWEGTEDIFKVNLEKEELRDIKDLWGII